MVGKVKSTSGGHSIQHAHIDIIFCIYLFILVFLIWRVEHFDLVNGTQALFEATSGWVDLGFLRTQKSYIVEYSRK